MVDKSFCMSQYLAFRYVFDDSKLFFENNVRKSYPLTVPPWRHYVRGVEDMDEYLSRAMEECIGGRDDIGLFLSGGMDSAILATYLPRGTRAYTFRNLADGTIAEEGRAEEYAKVCGLDLKIVDFTWDDFLELAPELMKSKGAPLHSIEVMLYKASKIAKSEGLNAIVTGEGVDGTFGGSDKLISKDWKFDEFVKRYCFSDPAKVLRKPADVSYKFEPYRIGTDDIDYNRFLCDHMSIETHNSFTHSMALAGIKMLAPYGYLGLEGPLDIARIRSGDTKYLVRRLFRRRYPGMREHDKIPLPRGVAAWLKDWVGPVRDEFAPGCIDGATGDQKWQCWCLERFLNLHDEGVL